MRFALTVLVFLVLATGAFAQGLTISSGHTTQSVIAAQKGKRITVRLRSGQELSGREFFDAAVPIDAIEAVLVRTRQQ